MVARMALIVWLLESKMCFWLYEQPHSSLLWEHPRMQDLVKRLKIYRAHIHMGSYGATSPKPTFLWAPTISVYKFSLPLPQDQTWEPTVTKTTRADGSTCVTGNGHLKSTQTYPKEFGLATLRVWKNAIKKKEVVYSGPPMSVWNPKDMWKDAQLDEVFQYLSLGTMR